MSTCHNDILHPLIPELGAPVIFKLEEIPKEEEEEAVKR